MGEEGINLGSLQGMRLCFGPLEHYTETLFKKLFTCVKNENAYMLVVVFLFKLFFITM